jgi:hypothetical protein
VKCTNSRLRAIPLSARTWASIADKGKRPLFEKNGAKTSVYAGSWALSATMPEAQISKVFLLLFVHKK